MIQNSGISFCAEANRNEIGLIIFLNAIQYCLVPQISSFQQLLIIGFFSLFSFVPSQTIKMIYLKHCFLLFLVLLELSKLFLCVAEIFSFISLQFLNWIWEFKQECCRHMGHGVFNLSSLFDIDFKIIIDGTERVKWTK